MMSPLSERLIPLGKRETGNGIPGTFEVLNFSRISPVVLIATTEWP
jgi:hypothetical protein